MSIIEQKTRNISNVFDILTTTSKTIWTRAHRKQQETARPKLGKHSNKWWSNTSLHLPGVHEIIGQIRRQISMNQQPASAADTRIKINRTKSHQFGQQISKTAKTYISRSIFKNHERLGFMFTNENFPPFFTTLFCNCKMKLSVTCQFDD